MNPDYDGLPDYDRLGWVPCDWEGESVSKTLEYAYDDWCIARMAKALGKTADYEHFIRRAGSYKNIFDPSVGLHARQGSRRPVAHALRSRTATPTSPKGPVGNTPGTFRKTCRA